MSKSIDKDNELHPESMEDTKSFQSSISSGNTNRDTRKSRHTDKFLQYLAHEHTAYTEKYEPTLTEYIASKFPIIETLQNYNIKTLVSDMSAGVTIGAQLLPKSMAYAMMAGLSKSNGVIVAMMCTLLYPLCGSTPFLCTGPDPIICLLISNAIQSLWFGQIHFDQLKAECADNCSQTLREEWLSEKTSLIGLITIFVVFYQIFGNFINAGFISNFLTKPIVDSFVCSAALIILFKQLHYCLNMHSIKAQGTLLQNVKQLIQDVPGFINNFTAMHLVVVVLSFVTLLILFGLHAWSHSANMWGNKFAKRIPAVLLVVILGIAFTFVSETIGQQHWFGEHPSVELVGQFDVSFTFGFTWPGIKLHKTFGPIFTFKHLPDGIHITLWDIMWHAFVISITSYFCSMIVSRKLAVKKGFSVDPNREMLGLGIANTGCLVFGAFPCGGILATSVAVLHTSAKTRIWSICCAIIVILLSQIPICTLLLAKLPKAVLAAIVIETVIPLISFQAVYSIGSVLALDLLQYAATMTVCFLYGIEIGIIAGMVVAVFELVYRGTRNRVSELGRLPQRSKFKKLTNYPQALIGDRVLICRVYDSLFFTNWFPVQQAIQALMQSHENRCGKKDHLVGVVINLVSCGNIDSTASFGLYDFCKKNAKCGIAVRLSALTDSVYRKLKAVGIQNIHDCGIKYKFYKNDHHAVVDIIEHHKAIHFSGSLHMSEAVSTETSISN